MTVKVKFDGDDTVQIECDVETAEYIAGVMQTEYMTQNDLGAREITQSIEEAIADGWASDTREAEDLEAEFGVRR